MIAKLDRLARNVHFIASLMESGVEFVAVDFPQANRLTVNILAAVAEYEAAMISERTVSAPAAAKARRVTLGGLPGDLKTAQELLRHANSRITLDAYTRPISATKREPDIVLVELQRKAAEQGVRASTVHLWRILRKLGLRLKKSRSTPSSATPKTTYAGAKSTSRPSPRSRPKT